MKDHRTEPGLPTVINKLGKMTAIRDTYLVEQSLLRTLGPLLGVLETSLYRVDDEGLVVRALHHARKAVAESDGSHRVIEQIEEAANDQDIPDAVRALLENVRLLDKPCSRKTDGDLLIGYPLKGGTELCGYFVFARDRDVTPVEDAIVHGVLEVFANYYALLDTSQRDRLTGLLNRYSLELNLDRLWYLLATRVRDNGDEGVRRQANPQRYWIGVLDIDHFKNINDSFGHIIGDEVLIIATRLLQSALRRTDLLYRYGGEEFVAIISAADAETAARVFERVRKKIEQFQFPQAGQVTISGGFCGADPTVLPREVINRADSALYEAKRAGRNRIFHYDALIAEGILKEVESGSIDLF
jgi:diguanylate cyclase (GGDEF)-like protein